MHSALVLLERARGLRVQAAAAESADERFRLAHLAALRAGAAALAVASPVPARRRLQSVWVQLGRRAPEYGEWAGYFAAGASARAAIEAGALGVVTDRAADDLCRGVEQFVALVESRVGVLAVPLAS